MSEGSPMVTWRIVRLEETHATTDVTPPPRPAAGAVPAFEASSHRNRAEPPTGADHRRDRLDELEELVQAIRLSKLKSAAGRPPHLRALIGALVFRALRYRTYRELEDL